MFAKADLDDDGFVTAEDFYNIMTHRVYWDNWNDSNALDFILFIFLAPADEAIKWRVHHRQVQQARTPYHSKVTWEDSQLAEREA